MCYECICMVHSWPWVFVKLNMACEPLRIFVFFFNFLSIEIFEDYVIQDNAHRSGEAQKTSKTLCYSIVLVLGFLGPCLSRFKFMHFIIAYVDE